MRANFAVEQGLDIFAENGDIQVSIITGSAAPGSAAQENNAPVGTLYLRQSGELWQKTTAGSGTDKWTQATSTSLMTFRGELLRAVTNDSAPGGSIASFTDDEGTLSTHEKYDLASDSAHQDIQFGGAVTGATATGLANDATVYTATVYVDGVANNITVTGSAAQTITTLVAQILADLTGATATFDDANDRIKIDHSTVGSGKTIRIVDGTLIAALTAGGGATLSAKYIALQSGDYVLFDADGTPVLYKANVVTDGTGTTFTTTGVAALGEGDAFIATNYLPDSPDSQELSALVLFNGTTVTKLSDVNWNFADGIGMGSGYTAGSGNPTSSDTVQTAIQKIDGNVDAVNTSLGTAQGATSLGTITDAGTHPLSDNASVKTLFQEIENEIDTYKAATAVTGIVTLDEVLVDNVVGVEWEIWSSLDSAPARVKLEKLLALHNGTASTDATSTDQNVGPVLRIGAAFTVNVSIDLNGTGASQTMRLRVDAPSAVSVKSRRIEIK